MFLSLLSCLPLSSACSLPLLSVIALLSSSYGLSFEILCLFLLSLLSCLLLSFALDILYNVHVLSVSSFCHCSLVFVLALKFSASSFCDCSLVFFLALHALCLFFLSFYSISSVISVTLCYYICLFHIYVSLSLLLFLLICIFSLSLLSPLCLN